MFRMIAAASLLCLLTACATMNAPVISADPVQTVTNALLPQGGVIVTGLQNTAYNLDQAIAINVLAVDDPADKCVHGFLQTINADVGQMPAPPTPEFQTKVSDLFSAGSVAYILAEQARKATANGGIMVPASCEQLIGHFVLLGAKDARSAISVIRALP